MLLRTTDAQANGYSQQVRTPLAVSKFRSRNNTGRSEQNCILPRSTPKVRKRRQRGGKGRQNQQGVFVNPFRSLPLASLQALPSSALSILSTLQHTTARELSRHEQHLQPQKSIKYSSSRSVQKMDASHIRKQVYIYILQCKVSRYNVCWSNDSKWGA